MTHFVTLHEVTNHITREVSFCFQSTSLFFCMLKNQVDTWSKKKKDFVMTKMNIMNKYLTIIQRDVLQADGAERGLPVLWLLFDVQPLSV